MAVVLESSVGVGSAAGGILFDYDVPSVDHGVLLIGVGFRDVGDVTMSNITDNLGSFSLLGSISNPNNIRVEVWIQSNPVPGTHGILVGATTPTSTATGIAVGVFSGVDQANPLAVVTNTGNGTAVSVFADSVIDGMVFDIMASMRPTAVSQANPSDSTEILRVPVTGAMVASQATNGGAVTEVGWNLSVAKEWCILAVTLPPYVAPSTVTVAGPRVTISDAIASRLRTIPILANQVYEYHPAELVSFPTCSVIADGFYDEILNEYYNMRTYQFSVVVWVEAGKDGRDDAERQRRRVEDEILTALDADLNLRGAVLWEKPVSAGWGYSVDKSLAFLIINIEAKRERYIRSA